MKKLNFIDIFCGAGGLSCGLEIAGFNCLLGIDFNKHAIETFKANHHNASSYLGDISKLKEKELATLTNNEKIHCVVGGPPCQGFSTVGKGDPNDDRNKLFLEFLRVVKWAKPDFLVIENVTGLVAKKNEKTLNAIFKKFNSLGYVMEARVLESQHYGVPERRKRTILLGSKVNSEICFPYPTHDKDLNKKLKKVVTVGDVLEKINCRNGKALNHDLDSTILRTDIDLKRLKKIPEGAGIRYQKDELKYLPKSLRLAVDWNELPESRFRQTKYQRLDRQKPSPTIMTQRQNYYHPTEHRFLTPREAAKLQSFPNNFEFKGPVTAQWKQIGNAVPPLLGVAIGKAILDMSKMKKRKATSKDKKTAKEIGTLRKGAFKY